MLAPTKMPQGMKGLTAFVVDIRNCTDKDQERKRVDKELAKIRAKFAQDKSLSGYDKKKYLWKLLYCYMLGYEVNFGHIQAVNLCGSTKYSEKRTGYVACAILLGDNPEVLRLIINVCKSDLQNPANEAVASLALNALANVGGPEFAENLFPDIVRYVSSPTGVGALPGAHAPGGSGPSSRFGGFSLFGNSSAPNPVEGRESTGSHTGALTSGGSSSAGGGNAPAASMSFTAVSAYLKRKAVLCALRMHRRDPDSFRMDEWMVRVANLLTEKDVGLLTSAMSLLIGFLETARFKIPGESASAATASTSLSTVGLTRDIAVPTLLPVIRQIVLLLSSMVSNECPGNYMYYSVPAPWLQVKLYRALQFLPVEAIDDAQVYRLNEILQRMTSRFVDIVVGPSEGVSRAQSSNSRSPPGAVNDRSNSSSQSRPESSSRPNTPPKASRQLSSGQGQGSAGQHHHEKINKVNAEHAVLLEAINLIIHLGPRCDRETRRSAASLLGTFISAKDANTRYLGLEAMSRLAKATGEADVVTQASERKLLDKFKKVIATQLSENDVSIKRHALNLLFVICDRSNCLAILDELLNVLASGEAGDFEEELVLKIAILSENFAPDPTWVVDIVYKMLEYAPGSVGDDVWFRVVQIVARSSSDEAGTVKEGSIKEGSVASSGGPGVQLYASMKAFEYLGGHISGSGITAHQGAAAHLVGSSSGLAPTVSSSQEEGAQGTDLSNMPQTSSAMNLSDRAPASEKPLTTAANAKGTLHETLMKFAVYLLGEFGHVLVNEKRVSPTKIASLMKRHMPKMSYECRAMTLTALAKVCIANPKNQKLADEVLATLNECKDSMDVDLQQRACELLSIVTATGPDAAVFHQALSVMPVSQYSVNNNPLIKRLKLHTKTRAVSRKDLEIVAKSQSSVLKSHEANTGRKILREPSFE